MARTTEEELAATPPDEERQQRLGERLRRLRHLRKLTIEQVAGEVGLSMSFLSMLERGQADISLSRFSRLAEFYRISPSELLVEDETKAGPTIVAPESLRLIDRGAGVTYRLLESDHSGAQTVLATFEPGASFSDVLAHKGRDFGWVISGELVLLYSDREYVLEARQFVEYDASKPHAFRNDGDRPAEMIAFISSPYW